MWGIRICRPYLEYVRFRVHSDHKALRWLFAVSVSESNPRLVRWRRALSAYDFEVVYKPGAQQRVADELSRIHTTSYALKPTENEEEGRIPCLIVQEVDKGLAPSPTVPRTVPLLKLVDIMEAISLPELEEAQASDSWCKDMLREMEETRGVRTLKEYSRNADEILSCRKTQELDASRFWLARPL